MRIFAKVPRAIIRSLPLLAPYELKSFFYIPFDVKYLPAGEFIDMLPAGDIWSVVIESPNIAKIWAFCIGGSLGRSGEMLEKNGGLWI